MNKGFLPIRTEKSNMHTKSPLRIAFISTLFTPFIQDDLNTLKKFYSTKERIGSGLSHIIKIILACFRTDIVFCWFASTYSSVAVVLMRLLHRRSIIVIGGVDAAKEKELNYGIWLVPWKAFFVGYALRNADKILAVDKSLADKARTLAGYDGSNIEIVPTGYDIDFWKIAERNNSNAGVLTVANADNEQRFRVKGLDILFEAARMMPEVSFTVIGLSEKIAAIFNSPPNIKVLPPVERKQLLTYYQNAKVYCQPSRHEGMPNALCEAMLCGCIPVATDAGATKNIIGDVGFCIHPEANAAALALADALLLPEATHLSAREKIASRFNKEAREIKLTQIIELLKK
ncbi:MAG: glycosyltransferase family 4 protein [Bacteroidetes bacterium]|nr:glycosyltransferase family 4 protein [Bacteroidota bacterium]